MQLKLMYFPSVFFAILYTPLNFVLIHCRQIYYCKVEEQHREKTAWLEFCFLLNISIFWDKMPQRQIKIN
jgi:hypothetical protein